jgi:ribulose-phosphate 3-epimerase
MSVMVAPSILSADFGALAEQIKIVEAAGADWIHVDVMDGHFVPNITIGPVVVEAARRATRLPLDVHLMISDPDLYIEPFAEAGADILTVHVEACPHLHRTVQAIHKVGVQAGVAINPATALTALEDILPQLDLVVVMSVNPGFGGQSFIGSTPERVEKVRSMIDAIPSGKIRLEVDGGIDAMTGPIVVDAGADVLVAGSAVFRHTDGPAAGMEELRNAIGGDAE